MRLIYVGYAHNFLNINVKISLAQSSFSFGWSHGKEIMNGKPDFAKGSYYNNPMTNTPASCSEEGYSSKYPFYGFPNIWPTTALPDLESAFMEVRKWRNYVDKF